MVFLLLDTVLQLLQRIGIRSVWPAELVVSALQLVNLLLHSLLGTI